MNDSAASRQQIEDLLPLTPRVLLILWALGESDNHGYGLLHEVERLGRGRVSIKAGSLYEAIDTLSRRGLIEEVSTEGRRRTYALSSFGREVLLAEVERLDDLVSDLRTARLVSEARDG